jgi:hypothetical protein
LQGHELPPWRIMPYVSKDAHELIDMATDFMNRRPQLSRGGHFEILEPLSSMEVIHDPARPVLIARW